MGTDSVEKLLKIYQQRHNVLRLFSDGIFDKQAVEARLDVSRPTLDRVYRDLEANNILTSVGTTYDLTAFGDFVCRNLEQSRRVLEPLAELEPILSELPADAGIDRRLLDGADVLQADDHVPMEPFMTIVEDAREANQIQGYSTSLRPYIVEAFYSLIMDEGIPTTLVLRDVVVDAVYENFEEQFEEILAADHATIYETPITETYGLVMADETVAVPVADQPVGIQAVIVNDTDAALEWGTELLDRLINAEQARQL